MEERARVPQADAELVSAARAGDKHAFAELVRRHRPLALRLAARMLVDQDLASDAVQEAVLRAYLDLDRLRCPERFAPWLCGIALNVSRRWLRELWEAVPVGTPSDPVVAPGPDEQYERTEAAELVHGAVSRLAPGQRDAILLFYWQGLTHIEVAKELGISVGAVKARLHQARVNLGRTLPTDITDREVPTMPLSESSSWVDASVAEIRRGEGSDPTRRPHVVLLEEQSGNRKIPIWIGPAEATALALNLETVEMPRPMTYHLASSLLSAAGSHVSEVRITRLVEDTFYAVVIVTGPEGSAEVDARPSDALNLAITANAPIKVEARLLDEPMTADRPDWRDYRTGCSELVSEVLTRHEEMRAE